MCRNLQHKEVNEQISICRTIMEATTGPLMTHQRAVFSFVSQQLGEEEEENTVFSKSCPVWLPLHTLHYNTLLKQPSVVWEKGQRE